MTRRIGHKGADLIHPGNTTGSFDAALRCGVDMIEFDVLPADHRRPADSPLYLAHDYEALATEGDACTTLEQGLEHLRRPQFDGIDLDVDLKVPGYEDRVIDALRRHGMLERSLVSSQYIQSLDRVRALEPSVRLGWSVPKVKRDYTKSRVWILPALGVLLVMQRRLPRQAAAMIRSGRVDALMAYWRLVTPALVRAVRDAGGELYVWTVDDAERISRFERMGVTGVITNDPRLFTPAPELASLA